MSNQELVFEIKDLEKTYTISRGLFKDPQVVNAVNKINFNVYHGETYSIVGESGCGKSTTAKMLLNIEEPTKGKIFFRGKDISTFTALEWKEYRKKVQIIFQDPYSSLNPRWTVGKIIAEPLLLNTDMSKKEIVEKGIALDAPLRLTWSCYKNEDVPCGKCDSCALRAMGFEQAGIVDPIL